MSMYENLVMQTQMNYSRYYGRYAAGKTPVRLSDREALPYEKMCIRDRVSTCGAPQIRRHRGGLGMDAFLLCFRYIPIIARRTEKSIWIFKKPLQFLSSYRCWMIFQVESNM